MYSRPLLPNDFSTFLIFLMVGSLFDKMKSRHSLGIPNPLLLLTEWMSVVSFSLFSSFWHSINFHKVLFVAKYHFSLMQQGNKVKCKFISFDIWSHGFWASKVIFVKMRKIFEHFRKNISETKLATNIWGD